MARALTSAAAAAIAAARATLTQLGAKPFLDRLDAVVVEDEVWLVVHAVQALDDGFLELVDHVGAFAGDGVDAMDAFVVNLDLEVLAPAAVAAQP